MPVSYCTPQNSNRKQKQQTDELEENPPRCCHALDKQCSPAQFSVCSVKAFYGHVPTLSCKAESLLFSYSLYIAQNRSPKILKHQKCLQITPNTLLPKASSENTVQRLHDFSSIRHLDLQTGRISTRAYSGKTLDSQCH